MKVVTKSLLYKLLNLFFDISVDNNLCTSERVCARARFYAFGCMSIVHTFICCDLLTSKFVDVTLSIDPTTTKIY